MAGVEFPVKLVCKKRDNTDRHTKMCGETATNKTCFTNGLLISCAGWKKQDVTVEKESHHGHSVMKMESVEDQKMVKGNYQIMLRDSTDNEDNSKVIT